MKSTYTIIDNFDKLDLSFAAEIAEQAATADYSYIRLSPAISVRHFPSTAGFYENLKLSTHAETIHPT